MPSMWLSSLAAAAGALAPVPAYTMPLSLPVARSGSKEMLLDEQRRVLGKRHGTTISHRTILKSYQPIPGPAAAPQELQVAGVSEIMCASLLRSDSLMQLSELTSHTKLLSPNCWGMCQLMSCCLAACVAAKLESRPDKPVVLQCRAGAASVRGRQLHSAGPAGAVGGAGRAASGARPRGGQ